MSRSSDFLKYREMAPALVSDERINELILTSCGDVAAITKAIENMWHDIPDSKAVNPVAEWDVPSNEKRKAKKKAETAPVPADIKLRNKENREVNGPSKVISSDKNGNLAKTSKQAWKPGAAHPPQPQQPDVKPINSTSLAVTETLPDRPHAPPSVAATAISGSQWSASAMTFAEKLKQSEVLPKVPSPPAVEEEVSSVPPQSTLVDTPGEEADAQNGRVKRTRGKRSGRGTRGTSEDESAISTPDIAPEIIKLSELEASISPPALGPPGFFNSPEQHSVKISTVDDFKLPIVALQDEQPVDDDFQFGSVGLKEATAAPSPSWLSNEPRVLHDSMDGGVWATSSAAGPSSGIGVYQQEPKGHPTSTSAASKVASPPPGLELNGPAKGNQAGAIQAQKPNGAPQNNFRKTDSNVHANQPQQSYQPQLQAQQYQNVAIPHPNRGLQGSPTDPMSMGPTMPQYPYNAAGFEQMNASHFSQPYAAGPVSGSPAGQNAGVSSGSPNVSTNQFQGVPPGVPASYAFSGNPYYGNQFYYPNAQTQYFYGQPGQRGMYPPAQYATAPGMGTAPIYPDMYGQRPSNQFPEAAPYGNGMPVVPVGANNPAQNAHAVPNAAGGGKTSKNSNNPSSVAPTGNAPTQAQMLAQAANPNEMMYSSYGVPYATREGGWVMHQPWGAPMMQFPATQGGYSQPSGPPAAQGAGRSAAPGHGQQRNSAGGHGGAVNN